MCSCQHQVDHLPGGEVEGHLAQRRRKTEASHTYKFVQKLCFAKSLSSGWAVGHALLNASDAEPNVDGIRVIGASLLRAKARAAGPGSYCPSRLRLAVQSSFSTSWDSPPSFLDLMVGCPLTMTLTRSGEQYQPGATQRTVSP